MSRVVHQQEDIGKIITYSLPMDGLFMQLFSKYSTPDLNVRQNFFKLGCKVIYETVFSDTVFSKSAFCANFKYEIKTLYKVAFF